MSCMWAADGSMVCARKESHVQMERFTASTAPPPPMNFLRSDADKLCPPTKNFLRPGESMFSKNRLYMLTYQLDGNLVLRPAAVWAANVHDSAGKAVMQRDGNFVLLNAAGQWYFRTNTLNKGTGPFRLVIQGDRNLVLYDAKDSALWASGSTIETFAAEGACDDEEEEEECDAGNYETCKEEEPENGCDDENCDEDDEEVCIAPADTLYQGEELQPGQYLRSADGRYDIVYQRDGNLVMYGTDILWQSDSHARPGKAVMMPDGKIVLFDADGRSYWTFRSEVAESVGPYGLLVTDRGSLLVISADFHVVWDNSKP
ncbi:Mannose-specific lectin [Tetrabaena socialis]|uniref:Mannose-specific lectin n=1 Tax=Tetrabaena socialis TaxID=47790 RepID=A0A2J7ZVY3_9CHLO|nr:Mannose-specific lectin [Tetrabaena socialis]|eukprot:PNH04429.1 Mannose-specific lectin [Tetrabaena socialis]